MYNSYIKIFRSFYQIIFSFNQFKEIWSLNIIDDGIKRSSFEKESSQKEESK